MYEFGIFANKQAKNNCIEKIINAKQTRIYIYNCECNTTTFYDIYININIW